MLRLKYICTIIAILGPMFWCAEVSVAQLSIGNAMPMANHKMTSTSGTQVSLSDIKGAKGTVAIFWCNTCPWVTKYEDRVVALVQEYSAKGFGFMLINSNDPVAYPDDNLDGMKNQAASGNYNFPYVVDAGSQVAVAFGAKRTPHVFAFGPNNNLAYEGALDDSPSDPDKVEDDFLRNALDAIGAGTAVAMAVTKAFGCTIKFQ
jgi:hypothetical protein